MRQRFLTYALNQDGDLVHIDSVPNGNACGCVCPCCYLELCAKNHGNVDIKIHHFAHQDGSDCVGAVESVLHLMAKKILVETKQIRLPKLNDEQKSVVLNFDRVEVEQPDNNLKLRPDCVGYYGDKQLWIEFKRTHAVDAKKKSKIISAQIDCVEIDLEKCTTDIQIVKEFLINREDNRKWIFNSQIGIFERNALRGGGTMKKGSNAPDINRIFAVDENGNFANLKDLHSFDFNQHSYYCPSCKKEVIIGTNSYDEHFFVHLDATAYCPDEVYLHECAKEALYYKFRHNDSFEIILPQKGECSKREECPLYKKEQCQTLVDSKYDLKIPEIGYLDCKKNYHKEKWTSYDLYLQHRSNKEENSIIVNIISGNHCKDIHREKGKIIEIQVDNVYTILDLLSLPINKYIASYDHFDKTKIIKTEPANINRPLKTFLLYYSSKTYFGDKTCAELASSRNNSVVFEVSFDMEVNNNLDLETIALIMAAKRKYKGYFCELCAFCSKEINGDRYVCSKYKECGTPLYPENERPDLCPVFELHKELEEDFNKYINKLRYKATEY